MLTSCGNGADDRRPLGTIGSIVRREDAASRMGRTFAHDIAMKIARTALVLGLIACVSCGNSATRDGQSLLSPNLQKSEVWGFVAGFGTTFAAVPDIVAMFKRRSSAAMNPRMAAILAVFQAIWIYYGFLIGSRPVIAWNVIAVVINALSVAAYFYFGRERA
jgi:uncharacterized protein with PQ loop repeat